jgi:hypothetical protein
MPRGSAAFALLFAAFLCGTGPARAQSEQHWAFQKLVRPTVPPVKEARRVRSAVDAFVLAKLETHGLSFAAEADRATLVRRAYLDLIGLPPSPEEVAAFLTDESADAYERLLDRLLASPHFGERWGRHWLDEAGYVDVLGLDNDAGTVKLPENRWLYRDYVVRALNRLLGTPFRFQKHATLLHQLGLDHHRLSYRHQDSDETLTDARVTNARVVQELLRNPPQVF